jgi:GntR family transcriptional regulator/MocR family aminotransferase
LQAVSLLAMALRQAGHSAIGVEDPCWTRLRPPLDAAGLEVVPVTVDDKGLRVADLTAHREAAQCSPRPRISSPPGW